MSIMPDFDLSLYLLLADLLCLYVFYQLLSRDQMYDAQGVHVAFAQWQVLNTIRAAVPSERSAHKSKMTISEGTGRAHMR